MYPSAIREDALHSRASAICILNIIISYIYMCVCDVCVCVFMIVCLLGGWTTLKKVLGKWDHFPKYIGVNT